MILIADGGSTKCDWLALAADEVVLRTNTKGLNPAIFNLETLKTRINANEELAKVKDQVTAIHFYGAGCSATKAKANLEKVLQAVFTRAKIHVLEDIYGAVYAVTTTPAIVCILGTGSNSCYFDGKTIHSKIPSLGYTIMDEASGNYIGKQLLRDYFYGNMPKEIATVFEADYDLNPDTIKENLYKKDNPNTYLAGFAKFVFTQDLTNAYFYNLLTRAFATFIKNHVLCYEKAQDVPLHFIGSIAHYGSSILNEVLKKNQLQLGKIIQKPIDGLRDYHLKIN